MKRDPEAMPVQLELLLRWDSGRKMWYMRSNFYDGQRSSSYWEHVDTHTSVDEGMVHEIHKAVAEVLLAALW